MVTDWTKGCSCSSSIAVKPMFCLHSESCYCTVVIVQMKYDILHGISKQTYTTCIRIQSTIVIITTTDQLHFMFHETNFQFDSILQTTNIYTQILVSSLCFLFCFVSSKYLQIDIVSLHMRSYKKMLLDIICTISILGDCKDAAQNIFIGSN